MGACLLNDNKLSMETIMVGKERGFCLSGVTLDAGGRPICRVQIGHENEVMV